MSKALDKFLADRGIAPETIAPRPRRRYVRRSAAPGEPTPEPYDRNAARRTSDRPRGQHIKREAMPQERDRLEKARARGDIVPPHMLNSRGVPLPEFRERVAEIRKRQTRETDLKTLCELATARD